MAELLLDRGADKDAANKGGDTPLHNAASRGHLEFAKLLLDSGAAVDAANKVSRRRVTNKHAGDERRMKEELPYPL